MVSLLNNERMCLIPLPGSSCASTGSPWHRPRSWPARSPTCCNPIANIKPLEDLTRNFVVIMKDDKIFKNN